LGSASQPVAHCQFMAATKNLLLISGSKVRVLVRPPLIRKAFLVFFAGTV
jgi:hypothetical protein